jgi:hypothetical protein
MLRVRLIATSLVALVAPVFHGKAVEPPNAPEATLFCPGLPFGIREPVHVLHVRRIREQHRPSFRVAVGRG